MACSVLYKRWSRNQSPDIQQTIEEGNDGDDGNEDVIQRAAPPSYNKGKFLLAPLDDSPVH